MKNKIVKITMISIIIVIMIITAGVITWLAATSLQAPTQQSPLNNPESVAQSQPISQPTASETQPTTQTTQTNEGSTWFSNLKNEGGKFDSDDKRISFEYSQEVRLERKNDETTFWIIGNAGGDIGEMAMFGFNFMENRQGKIDELHKENTFYKDNPKNYYGKNDISISGHPATLYKFSDTPNPTEKDMINEIIFEYKNKIYSFEFGAGSQKLQKEILNSVKFN